MTGLRLMIVAVAAIAAAATPVFAAAPAKIPVMTHAAFYSAEMNQSQVVDPHIFVKDPSVGEEIGPLGIKHAAGLRPALLDRDPRRSALYTATGKPMDLTIEAWLGATFAVAIAGEERHARLNAELTGLKPNGHYSLFERQSDRKPVGFTPIDGTGLTNSFVAKPDGTAKVSIKLPHDLPHTSAVVLIYHSDDQDHGVERGRLGFDAHHLLMTRPE